MSQGLDDFYFGLVLTEMGFDDAGNANLYVYSGAHVLSSPEWFP